MLEQRSPTMTAHTREAQQADRVALYSGYRPEVQGLRAVAVLLVVIYHVFVGRVSGGVDIFLLISAFFMTLSFVRKIEGERRLDIPRYWLHTFRRLLPLASITIVGTLILLALFYPATAISDFRWQGLTSVFYVENWQLAAASVDYYATDHSTASPFQHFWSLSVQGQVFLLWPLIFGLAWLVRRRTGISSVPILAACFGLIFSASLVFSVITTESQQAFAYFDTRARLWEFALGSLIALAIPYLNPPRAVRIVLGWVGIVSMVSVGILVDVQGAFPGWIALWPLLSAAAIIVAGNTESPAGFDRFLSWGPVVKLGDAAYALYLVHWPFLITYLVIRDRPVAGWRSGIVMVLICVVLAVLVTKYIENPIRRWQWPERSKWRLGVVIGVCMALVIMPIVSWAQFDKHREAQIEAQAYRNNPGAAVLTEQDLPEGDPQAPLLPQIQGDYPKPSLGAACPAEMGLNTGNQQWCGLTVENPDSDVTILTFGNSHAVQWIPAVQGLAQEQDWSMVSYIRGNCLVGLEEPQIRDHAACEDWSEDLDKVMDYVQPDLVVMNGTRTTDDGGETMSPEVVERMDYFTSHDAHVLAVRDNPRFESSPGVCLDGDASKADECLPPMRDMVTSTSPIEDVAESRSAVSALDMNDLICPEGRCSPEIGRVIVYWDNNHLTQTYVRSLVPMFIDRAVQQLRTDGFL